MYLQPPLFEPETKWKAPVMADLPSWAGAKRVSIDSETNDQLLSTMGIGVRRGAYTVGWSFTLEYKDGSFSKSYYLPTRHEGGDNLPKEEVDKYLIEQSKRFEGEVVGANLDYDLDFAIEDGLDFRNVTYFRDVQIADPLIYELYDDYSLEAIGNRWNIKSKDEDLLRQACIDYGLYEKRKKRSWKKHIWRLPARHVGTYAELDSASPLKLLREQEKVLAKNGCMRAFDQESQLLPILVNMRRRGVRIDFDKLDKIEQWTKKEQTTALDFVKRETGYDIGYDNVWKPDAIEPVLRKVGYTLTKTATNKWSIENSALESFDHPVTKAVRWARKVARLRDTFAASMRRYECNGRIHCTYNQIAREDEAGGQRGVRYGRLSSVHPNLQQQPSKDRDPDIAGEWRKIFIPEPSTIWACLDYSQQEPRWTTHFAAVLDLPRAREAAQRYIDDPSTDNHNLMTQLIHGQAEFDRMLREDPKGEFKVARGAAKCIFLGLCYGEGGPKLCHDLNLPTRWAHHIGSWRDRVTVYYDDKWKAQMACMKSGEGFIREEAGEEGEALLKKFDKEVPFVRKVAQAASNKAAQAGFVMTYLKRRLHFPKRDNGRFDWTHKALNRVIQGTSAEQTKQAVIEMYRAGHYLQLQVHDEINFSASSVSEAKQAAEIMANVFECIVPHKVDVEVGPSWGEIKEAA